MNEHSLWRISLARKIAPLFTVHPKVEACFVFGSVALGISDQYGEDVIKPWQMRLSDYPEELAVVMIQKHLQFRPFDGQDILTERLEIPMLYENNCAIARWLINLLFGLNRMYHPGFKWSRHFVGEMQIKPVEFFARLELVFQSGAAIGTHELRQLSEEVFDLIEAQLPQVDLKSQRERFDRLYPRWEVPRL
jgi:hypothetical protein